MEYTEKRKSVFGILLLFFLTVFMLSFQTIMISADDTSPTVVDWGGDSPNGNLIIIISDEIAEAPLDNSKNYLFFRVTGTGNDNKSFNEILNVEASQISSKETSINIPEGKYNLQIISNAKYKPQGSSNFDFSVNSQNKTSIKVTYNLRNDDNSYSDFRKNHIDVMKKHNITYDLDGGTFPTDTIPMNEFEEGRIDPYDVPIPSKKGYMFEGWTTDEVTIPKQNLTLDETIFSKNKDINLKANWGIGSLHILYSMEGNGAYASKWIGNATYVQNKEVWGAATSSPAGYNNDGYVIGYADSTESKQVIYEEVFPFNADNSLKNFYPNGLSDIFNPYWIAFAAPAGYHVEQGQEWYADINGTRKYFSQDVTTYTLDDFVGNDFDPDNPKDYYVTLHVNWTNTTGWRDFSGKWMYINEDGTIQKQGWKEINGKWYYFGATNQKMYITEETNWLHPSWGWVAYRNTWADIDGMRYYFNDSCEMVLGWQYIDGKWYYFDSDGKMQTGWFEDNGYWYYLTTRQDHDAWGEAYPVGSMLSDTYVDQDRRYYFDSSGHCTNPYG